MIPVKDEKWVIRGGIIAYWFFFWLLNVVDKAIVTPTVYWVGKDRMTQFINYFSSIGVTNELVPQVFLAFTTFLELAALIFMTYGLWHFFRGDHEKAHNGVFMGIFFSLVVFSFFAIGDQVFGDRVELLEHSTYWIALVLSWFVFTQSEK